MMDEKGRVWFTARVRPPANPDFCKKGSDHPSAKVFPLESANRHLSMYDPATGKFTLISTCFPTHHLIFAEDANHTLWTSSWRRRPAASSAGSTARCSRRPATRRGRKAGRRSSSTPTATASATSMSSPISRLDPTKDKRVAASLYSVAVNPVDGSVWGTSLGFPGYVVRVNPGAGSDAHGADRNLRAAVAGLWAARRRHRSQRRLLGVARERPSRELRSAASARVRSTGRTPPASIVPKAGRSIGLPGPQFRDVTDDGSAEASYYTWVDRFDTFGLGATCRSPPAT